MPYYRARQCNDELGVLGATDHFLYFIILVLLTMGRPIQAPPYLFDGTLRKCILTCVLWFVFVLTLNLYF